MTVLDCSTGIERSLCNRLHKSGIFTKIIIMSFLTEHVIAIYLIQKVITVCFFLKHKRGKFFQSIGTEKWTTLTGSVLIKYQPVLLCFCLCKRCLKSFHFICIRIIKKPMAWSLKCDLFPDRIVKHCPQISIRLMSTFKCSQNMSSKCFVRVASAMFIYTKHRSSSYQTKTGKRVISTHGSVASGLKPATGP